MKGVEGDVNEWKDNLCLQTGRIFFKCPQHPKESVDSVHVCQNSNDNFHKNRKNNPKLEWKHKRIQNHQSNFEPKEQTWRYHAT